MKQTKDLSAIGAAGIGTGAALTATLASACCVGPSLAPLAISLLGAGGLIAVSALRPYTALLLIGAALMLAFSFRQSYARKSNCSVERTAPSVSRGIRVCAHRYVDCRTALGRFRRGFSLWISS